MRDLALIYSLPPEPQYLKSLLLFFDGLIFLGDPRHVTIGLRRWPELFEPLFESKVAQHVSTDSVFDDALNQAYAARLNQYLDAGVFDEYQPKVEPGRYMFMENFPALGNTWQKSREHAEDTLLAQAPGLMERLRSRGLVADLSLPKAWNVTGSDALGVDRRLRSITTALVSQFARTSLARQVGAAIHPIAESDDALSEVLDLPRSPSRGHVYSVIWQLVSPTLELVSLPDILSFASFTRQSFGYIFDHCASSYRRFRRLPHQSESPPAMSEPMNSGAKRKR